MLLSLIIWLGGLILFAVVAQTAFAVLPTRHLAGSLVSATLPKLHWMGMISGVVFLIASMLYARMNAGSAHAFAPRHVLVYAMLILTIISQFAVLPKMAGLRASMGEIDRVPVNDSARVAFDSLHVWSTRLEQGVLVIGLLVVYLTAAQFH
jgi:hypothetical protein